MRLLNSIHDEIGNRSFACWFCVDFSLEIGVQTNRSKGMYVEKRFAVCSGAKNIFIQLARHRNYRQILNLRSRYRRKTNKCLPPKNYRRTAFRPKKYRHIFILPLPPKHHHRIALPPKKHLHILLLPLPPKSLPPKLRKPSTA